MKPQKWLPGQLLPILFLLMALLLQLLPGFWLTVCRAQGKVAQGLGPGQQVPQHLSLQMVNHPTPTATLSDFKGKLLLLDFWATWCSSSRAPLPLLDSLQHAYGDQLQVLLVSYTAARDNKASVTAFFEKWRKPDGSRYRLPSVVEDTSLIRLFPHTPIPHFAWVAPDGTVQAITRSEQVTAHNISSAIREGIMPPTLRPDLDLSRPLLTNEAIPPQAARYYATLLQGSVDDGPARLQVRQNGDAESGLVAANMSLLELYTTAKRNLYPEFGSKGLVLELVDSARLFPTKSGLAAADWKARHTYTYDLLLPEGTSENPYRVLLDDLNRYSGYRATLEPRETDCLRLVRKGRKDKLKSKGGEPENRLYSKTAPSMQHMPLSTLVARLNSNNTLPLLVVNETGYTDLVDIELKAGFTDLPALRKELRAYGLDLVPARRKVPLFVLRELHTSTDNNSHLTP
ncbi:TlpA disulfide reductase family protein [Pontibacter sp. SGAir0037]|uniref:TlpA family protein disulfide reductase n=1 Tax=Pontibacter sp. SGAir0037 TaxID=2571030 RepID=UPI0010CCD553|nr:TlpA disulfide reductase family protein [Pontibacter sp. SGAir0037]QCR22354.1 hypothetical protein C1N53_08390 [Pontibacter sp. SGAir0037]